MLNVSCIKSQTTWFWHVDSSRLLLEYFSYDLAGANQEPIRSSWIWSIYDTLCSCVPLSYLNPGFVEENKIEKWPSNNIIHSVGSVRVSIWGILL